MPNLFNNNNSLLDLGGLKGDFSKFKESSDFGLNTELDFGNSLDSLLGDFSMGQENQSLFGKTKNFLGKNGSTIFDGALGLGSLYNNFKGQELAKDNLNFQKNAYFTNLNNSVKSFNTALEDRIRSRYHTEGKTEQDVQAYVDKNQLQGR